MKLTEKQENGLKLLKEFIEAPTYGGFFLLKGFAGTGKSTLINEFISWYVGNRKKLLDDLVITAPTNKAVRVLKNMSKFKGKVEYKTLHSLLGIRPRIDENGKEVYEKDPKVQSTIFNFGCVIVDESSMIDDYIFDILISESSDIKIIFVGDGAQIPPVNHVHSKPMMLDVQQELKIKTFVLDEIVRQASDNPIIKVASSIRNGSFTREYVDNRDENGFGVFQMNNKNKEEVYNILKETFCSKEFSKDADYAKVLAWRNSTVNSFNNLIRNFIYYKGVNKIVEDEKIIINRPIMEGKDKVLLFVNDELIVTKLKLRSDSFYHKSIDYYECKAVKVDNGAEFTLKIIHENSEKVFEGLLNSLKTVALSKSKKDRSKAWKSFYDFKDIFADVSYNYALTAHKCISGSEKVCVGSEKHPKWVSMKDIQVGDLVRTGNGNYKPVINKIYTGKKLEFILTTRSGHTIKTSKDHKFKQFNGNDFIWTTMNNIKIGDYLCIDRNYSSMLEIDLETDYKYWFYGALLGDGSYNYTGKNLNRIDLIMSKEDSYIFQKIPFYYKKYSPKNKNVDILCIHNKKLKDELTNLGFIYDKNKIKKFPKFIYSLSLKEKISIIRGLMDTDGSVSPRSKQNIRFVNISEDIIDGLKTLLLDFGIISIKSKNKVYKNTHKQSYTLSITGSNLLKYKKYIGFELDRKKKILDTYEFKNKTNIDNIPYPEIVKSNILNTLKENNGYVYPNKHLVCGRILNSYSNLSYYQLDLLEKLSSNQNIKFDYDNVLNSNYYFDEVISIEIGNETDMYDIEVEDDHSFICNGIVVHNCQGSTYNKAFVCYSDIILNQNIPEMQRILYTACTRPSETLYIL